MATFGFPSGVGTTIETGEIEDGAVTNAKVNNSAAIAGSKLANVVHDTGNETVAGIKTFSSDPLIPDEVYGAGWNGVLEPPTKNAVYDKIEALQGAWTVVKKTADESRNTTTTDAVDTHLQFAMAANTNYTIRAWIAFSSASATPDFKYIIDGPVSPTAFQYIDRSVVMDANGSALTLQQQNNYGNTANTLAGAAAGMGFVMFEAFLQNGANAGTFGFWWSQATSNGTDTTVMKGSFIEYFASA